MREWRKIYRGISVSDKIANLSMDARWLFILLILHQDDRGVYAWSRAKMKSLVAGSTEWTTNDVQRLSAELDSAGLVEARPAYLKIVDGDKKNGNPYKWREPQTYDIPEYDLENNIDSTMLQQESNKFQQVALKNENLKLNNEVKKKLKIKKNEKARNQTSKNSGSGRFKDNEIS